MIAALAKLIDWSVLQLASLQLPPNTGLEEALRFLRGPDFIPIESQPGRVEFHPERSGLHFRFPTPRPDSFPENNIVYGRLYRCKECWQERPVVVLLHGGGDFFSHQFRFPLVARRCNRAGWNAVTMELPYHFQRRPHKLRGLIGLNDLNCLQMSVAFAQAVAEIRALIGWLLKEGCPAVALWGISWGASLAGLTAGHDARLSAIVLSVPQVYWMSRSQTGIFWRRIRNAWQESREIFEKLNQTPLNLMAAQPAIPTKNILLVEAIHDLCVGSKPIEDLWQAWGHPDIWRLPHGHVSSMGAPGLSARVVRWLAPRLERANTQQANQ